MTMRFIILLALASVVLGQEAHDHEEHKLLTTKKNLAGYDLIFDVDAHAK
jgi:hypothetical protein